jgi:hypothetical protein
MPKQGERTSRVPARKPFEVQDASLKGIDEPLQRGALLQKSARSDG